jgi:hypothetical protein
LAQKDLILLKHLQYSLGGVGSIYIKQSKELAYFTVGSIGDLTKVIIPHFDKYPLLTQKRADFELFKQIVNLMENKEHLTMEGLQKIMNIKASMNWGLSDKLKLAFPNTKAVSRPTIVKSPIISPFWLAGLVDAEGCFLIEVKKSSAHKLGYQVSLVLQFGQHSRDSELVKIFV